MLEEGRSNYVCAVYLDEMAGAAAFCDVSTGEFCVSAFAEDPVHHVLNELSRFLPREAVLSDGAQKNELLCDFLTKKLECMFFSSKYFFVRV